VSVVIAILISLCHAYVRAILSSVRNMHATIRSYYWFFKGGSKFKLDAYFQKVLSCSKFDDRIRVVLLWVYSRRQAAIYMSVSSGFILLVADESTFFTLITPSYNGPALWCENVLRSQQLLYFSYLLRNE
jgi:hypothetical protein